MSIYNEPARKLSGKVGRGNEFSPLTLLLGGAHKHKSYVDTEGESVRGNECLLLGARPIFVGNWKFQRVSRPQVYTTLYIEGFIWFYISIDSCCS